MQDAFFGLSLLFQKLIFGNKPYSTDASKLVGVRFFQKYKKSAVNLVMKSWDSQQSDET